MSEQNDSTIKERLSAARKLAREGRYEAARYILEQVEHPKARAMLEALEGHQDKVKSRPLITGQQLLAIMGIIGVVGIVIVPILIQAILQIPEQRLNDGLSKISGNISISEDEALYLNVVNYCYHITGYGGDLCLDWTDTLIADYKSTANDCFAPYLEKALLEEEDYSAISACLNNANVPPPL